MSVITGLDAIRKQIESRPQAGGERVDGRELTRNLKSGGSRKIRFIQELDDSAPGYDERYGLAPVVNEYEHPDIWWLKIVDTMDEEHASYPVEQNWGSKLTLYINVLDVDTGEVFYLNRSVLGGLGATIVESATERNVLTDAIWKIKKTGEGMKTKYDMTFLKTTDEPLDVDPDDLIDFRKSVLNEVPYEQQEAFVKQIEERVANKKADDGSAASSASDDDGDDVW